MEVVETESTEQTAAEVAGLMKLKMLITEGKNPRGIPASVFIVSHM
jgi:hypothetical protein